ncbi:unnamed protein product [Owenia fusiformis]|uniref:Sodium-coupled monocarboxylate transporter 1 n=1 Tax=Owenia fusiformis TaxID=6347 RepID=A0A8S4PY06_OWEFU|nr:unnamed protein product [Owenia fusiformis]
MYIPIYHRLRLTSVFEYLALRFNNKIRLLAVLIYSIQTLLFMSIQLYAASLTLAKASGIPFVGTVILNGLVCVVYTFLGGMKAVVWADVLQLSLIFCGCLAIVIQGSIRLGGIGRVFEIANEFGRIQFDEINPDPTTRHSVWGVVIGLGGYSVALHAANQQFVQRYLALKTKKRAQGALYLSLIHSAIILALSTLVGVVMFATYAYCDPIKLGHVNLADQMPAHLVMDLFGSLKGMPGLFIVTIAAAAMSTMSSGQNALAAVFLKDITKPIYEAIHKRNMTETFSTRITKCFSMVFGLAIIALAFLIELLKETVLTIGLKLISVLSGPLLGMFTLGILFPCANVWGVAAGFISSLGLLIWINAGVLIFNIRPNKLPTDISGCGNRAYDNTTSLDHYNTTPVDYFSTTSFDYFNTADSGLLDPSLYTTHTSAVDGATVGESGIFYLYRISYVWYTLTALIVTLVVGLPVSLIAEYVTGGYEVKDETTMWSKGCCELQKQDSESMANGSSTNVIAKTEHHQRTSDTYQIYNKGFDDECIRL